MPPECPVRMGSRHQTCSLAAKLTTPVEMKLAKNTALERNLERQVPIYMAAGDAQAGIKAIIFFTDQEERRATGILDKLGLLYHKDIVLIDARADNKPSGSKGSVAKIVWTTTAGSSCAVRTHKGLWRAGTLQQSHRKSNASPSGIPAWLPTTRMVQHPLRRPETPTLCGAPQMLAACLRRDGTADRLKSLIEDQKRKSPAVSTFAPVSWISTSAAASASVLARTIVLPPPPT